MCRGEKMVLSLGGLVAQLALPESTPEIAPVLPPVPVPWPASVYWAVALGGALVLWCIWVLIRFIMRSSQQKPQDPRAEALGHLRAIGQESLEPYPLSIAVSDILRRYVSAAYRVAAEQRTSPEFLDEVARSPHFSVREQELLQEFLQQVDLIKFARHQASPSEGVALLEQATRFVRGEEAQMQEGGA